MVPRDYYYRCFDDCTQVSLFSRLRAKSFFIQDTRVNLYVRSTLQKTSDANSIKNSVQACIKEDRIVLSYYTMFFIVGKYKY